MRKDFERWAALNREWSLERNGGYYIDPEAERDWQTWQACRAETCVKIPPRLSIRAAFGRYGMLESAVGAYLDYAETVEALKAEGIGLRDTN